MGIGSAADRMLQGYNLHFSIKGWEFLHQFLANFLPKKFCFSIAFFRSILYNNLCSPLNGGHCAGVLELVDEVDSKSIASDGVRVRFPPPVPKNRVRSKRTLFFGLRRAKARLRSD